MFPFPIHAATSPAAAALPVTSGLIRWWPNLFDVRDEVSGQEGVVVGVLPPVATHQEDETEFGRNTGWVLLQPAVTNEVFTLCVWVRCSSQRPDAFARLLNQESMSAEWLFQTDRSAFEFVISRYTLADADRQEAVKLAPDVWHHLAITRQEDGTSRIYVDGELKLDGRRPHPWPVDARWFSVGNSIKGGEGEFHGGVRDLAVFDRLLSEDDVRSFHEAGLPQRPAKNTPARRAATARSVTMQISTNVVHAPTSSWTQRRFTSEDGLPGNVVKAVLQARSGYLWVGTEDGLARFDGRRFRAFTSENTPVLGAVGQTVWSLAEDYDGTIWAGVFGGLVRIRGLDFAGFTNGLPQRFVLQVEPVGDGSLWVAGFKTTIPRGPCWLRRYHPETGFSSGEVVVPGHVRRLIASSNGVWFATEQSQQMLFWDGRSAAPTVLGIVHDRPPGISLAQAIPVPPGEPIRSWYTPSQPSNSWARVQFGMDGPAFHWLWNLNYSSRPWIGRWSGPSAINPWLGVGRDLGRLRDDVLERIELRQEPGGPEIACLCADRDGGAWFGTEEDGLHFVEEKPVQVLTTHDGLGANDVRSLSVTPDGALWIATPRGLSRWRDGRLERWNEAKLRAIASDRAGHVWWGLGQHGQWALACDQGHGAEGVFVGLDWQDPSNLRFARDGTLWVACERGLTWIKPEKLERQPGGFWGLPSSSPQAACGRFRAGNELPNLYPLGLIEGADGSMWMGSLQHGLFHVQGDQLESFSQPDGLPNNHCAPVHVDRSGAVWIVGPGAITRRSADRFETATEQHGLPRDVFLDMVEDADGIFWISGKRGIHRVIRRELEAVLAGRWAQVTSLTIGVRDGLLTPECSSLHYPSIAMTPGGRVWVATRNGLASFDPRRVQRDTKPLPAMIEQVVANGSEVPGLPRYGTRPGPLTLAAGSGRQLVFHYTAISLSAADRIRFRYRLDGYDKDWSDDTDLRLAFYTNLRPGDYRFRVKAANPHGVWSTDEAVLAFSVTPHLWQTRSFYLGMLAVVAVVAGWLHLRRLASERHYQQLRHQQDLMSEKARIAADMHDELGATLTQIAILSEVGKSQLEDRVQSRATLDRMARAAREVTSRMSDLVWATNPRNDTLENLSAYLREHAASQLEGTRVQTTLLFPDTLPERHVSALLRRNLLLILKESLQNLLKHSAATEAVIELSAGDEALTLRVHDNGRGFDPSGGMATGNGLGNMRRRMEDLRGSFTIVSAAGEGTDIVARVPWSSPS